MNRRGIGSITISSQISELQARLRDSGKGVRTLATAESATAGRIADVLTDVPGSSEYVCGGIVAYSNDAKMRLLGVRASSLSEYGAVSEEVACEMAEGGRRMLNADVCVSDSGIAGPGGATATKPVGLFYIALATSTGCRPHEFHFHGDRFHNKEAALEAALTLLRDYLVQCCDAQE